MAKKTGPLKNSAWANDPVTAYAREVEDGTIAAGPYVRAACKRHLEDLKTADARGLVWDKAAAWRALDFFPEVLTVEAEGEVQPFRLLDCWVFVVGSLFGWKRRDGWRRYRRAYVEGGKGSAKTPLAAGIGLYMMLADNELSPEVYAAGAKREQAMVMFGDVVKMVDRSPLLRSKLVKSGKNPVWQLTRRSTGAIFKPLSKDKSKSGPRPHCGLIDELHEHTDRYTIDMLQDGFKGRKQPLLFVITNSGFDRNSICWEWHEHATAVVEGLREDDELFAYVMALDESDDPLEDPACWPKTNPGLGITITTQYLESQVANARAIPGRENTVRRLNFCQWTDADVGWMTRNAWVQNEEELTKFEKGAAIGAGFEGAELYCGLDLSVRFDLTALACVFPEDDKLVGWIEYFAPVEGVRDREKTDRLPYLQWMQQGLMHGVPGHVVRAKYLAPRLAELQARYDLRFIAFDRYRHKTLAEECDELGLVLPWIEHPQGFRRVAQLPFPQFKGVDGKAVDNPLWMPESIQKLETRVVENLIRVQPSPITRSQVSSVVIKQDPAGTGNRVFDKRKAVGRIDGMVALAMATGAAEMRLPSLDISGFLANPVMTR